jgi:hypothetical protein
MVQSGLQRKSPNASEMFRTLAHEAFPKAFLSQASPSSRIPFPHIVKRQNPVPVSHIAAAFSFMQSASAEQATVVISDSLESAHPAAKTDETIKSERKRA